MSRRDSKANWNFVSLHTCSIPTVKWVKPEHRLFYFFFAVPRNVVKREKSLRQMNLTNSETNTSRDNWTNIKNVSWRANQCQACNLSLSLSRSLARTRLVRCAFTRVLNKKRAICTNYTSSETETHRRAEYHPLPTPGSCAWKYVTLRRIELSRSSSNRHARTKYVTVYYTFSTHVPSRISESLARSS